MNTAKHSLGVPISSGLVTFIALILLSISAPQAQASRSCDFAPHPRAVGIFFEKAHVTNISCDRGLKILAKYQLNKRLPDGWRCRTDAKYQIHCRNGRARVRGYFGGDIGRQLARSNGSHSCRDVSLAPRTDWVAVNVRAKHIKCGPARNVVRDINYDRSTPYECSYRPGPTNGLSSTLIRCVDGRRVVAWKQY